MRDDERCKSGDNVDVDVRTSELVKKILDEDRDVSLKTISIHFGVGASNVHRIIHEDHNMRKVCSRNSQ